MGAYSFIHHGRKLQRRKIYALAFPQIQSETLAWSFIALHTGLETSPEHRGPYCLLRCLLGIIWYVLWIIPQLMQWGRAFPEATFWDLSAPLWWPFNQLLLSSRSGPPPCSSLSTAVHIHRSAADLPSSWLCLTFKPFWLLQAFIYPASIVRPGLHENNTLGTIVFPVVSSKSNKLKKTKKHYLCSNTGNVGNAVYNNTQTHWDLGFRFAFQGLKISFQRTKDGENLPKLNLFSPWAGPKPLSVSI